MLGDLKINSRPVGNKNIAFGRKLKASELSEYRKTIQAGLDFLDKENFSLILPQPSFPFKGQENVGVGSPYNKGGKEFAKDINWWGFNSIQFLPGGKLNGDKYNGVSPLPYTSTAFSSNDLFINLEDLTTKKWGKILNSDTYEKIIKNKPKEEKVFPPADSSFTSYDEGVEPVIIKGENLSFYKYLVGQNDAAMREAFTNFQKQKTSDPHLTKINNEFNAFCKDENNSYWLEKDALYQALSTHHKTEEYEDWPDIDKNLFSLDENQRNKRIKEIKDDPKLAYEIGLYKFNQFVLHKQNKNTLEYYQKTGQDIADSIGRPQDVDKIAVKPVGDCEVAVGKRDLWGHPEVFLHDSVINHPPHHYWGLPLIDFKKIFTSNKKLGDVGKFLDIKFDKLFRENKGGLRVDYAPGVIDPWIGPKGVKHLDGSNSLRLLSTPDDQKFGHYSILGHQNIKYDEEKWNYDRYRHHDGDPGKITDEQIKEYSGIVREIILKAADKNGVPKGNIIFEEMDGNSPIPNKVVEQNDLSKIQLTRWGISWIKEKDWAMPGNHDNDPLKNWVNGLFQNGNENNLNHHVDVLKNDLKLDDNEANKIRTDKKEFTKYQFAELFASPAKNIQVLFSDFFGSNKFYNTPNKFKPENWRERIPTDYKNQYYSALENNEGLNIPEVLGIAIDAKSKKENKFIPEKLKENLNKFKNILKEPEKEG